MSLLRTSILIALLGSGSTLADAPLSSEDDAEELQDALDLSTIKLETNGKRFDVVETGRLYIFLDDNKYPVKTLSLACRPKRAGSISPDLRGGPYRGPGLYPIAFYAAEAGTCTLKNRDFAVTIVVKSLD